jgi:hypothetical protein
VDFPRLCLADLVAQKYSDIPDWEQDLLIGELAQSLDGYRERRTYYLPREAQPDPPAASDSSMYLP